MPMGISEGVYLYPRTQMCVRHIFVHVPQIFLGGYTGTWWPWLPLGRGVEITSHCAYTF